MTRINIVPPKELSDQHLVAEYREIFMVGPALQRSLKSSRFNVQRIPKTYTLGQGHVMFFYDKGCYLQKRYCSLRDQMISRGMKPNPSRVFDINKFPQPFRRDWVPSANELQIARERINSKIAQKKHWYRFTKPKDA